MSFIVSHETFHSSEQSTVPLGIVTSSLMSWNQRTVPYPLMSRNLNDCHFIPSLMSWNLKDCHFIPSLMSWNWKDCPFIPNRKSWNLKDCPFIRSLRSWNWKDCPFISLVWWAGTGWSVPLPLFHFLDFLLLVLGTAPGAKKRER